MTAVKLKGNYTYPRLNASRQSKLKGWERWKVTSRQAAERYERAFANSQVGKGARPRSCRMTNDLLHFPFFRQNQERGQAPFLTCELFL